MSEEILIRNLTTARLRERPLCNQTSVGADEPALLFERGLVGEPPPLAERLADHRPEADSGWEPEGSALVSRPVEF